MKSKKERFVSLVLTAVMALCAVFAVSFSAAGEDGGPVGITVSVQKDDSGFFIARKDYGVEPGLAEYYGYENDPDFIGGDEISALDALVAIHIDLFGNGDSDVNDNLTVTGGFITRIFGEDTSGVITFVNGEQPHDGVAVDYGLWGNQYTGYAVNQTRLADGDLLEIFYIQDTLMWGDYYAWFEIYGEKTEEVTLAMYENYEFTAVGYMSMLGMSIPEERLTAPIGNALVVPVEWDSAWGAVFAEPLATTDPDGTVTLRFDEPGRYILSLIDRGDGSPLMSPWLAVNVVPLSYVTVSVQQDDTGFLIARDNFDVYPGLAKNYGYENDPLYVSETEISALDALVAVHTALYGTDRKAVNDNLAVSGSGFITKIFGDDTSNAIIYVNGEQPHDDVAVDYGSWGNQYTGFGINQAKLENADLMEIFTIQDTLMWGDVYAWFESDGIKTEYPLFGYTDDLYEYTIMGYMSMLGMNIPEERWIAPIADALVVPVVSDGIAGVFGEPVAQADENGKVTLKFDEPGMYTLSVVDGGSGSPLMSPWIRLEIGETYNPRIKDVSFIDGENTVLITIDTPYMDAALLVTAAYDKDGRLLGSKTSEIKYDSTNFTVGIAENTYTVKVMMWDDAEGMTPLCGAFEKSLDDKVKSPFISADAPQNSASFTELGEVMEKTAEYLLDKVADPSVGTLYGEWTVLALARGGFVTEKFKDTYLANLMEYLTARNGVLANPG